MSLLVPSENGVPAPEILGAAPTNRISLMQVPADARPRHLGITLAKLDAGPAVDYSEPLEVKEYRGATELFTPGMGLARQCRGFAFKAPAGFGYTFQLPADDLLADPRVQELATLLVFVPVYLWQARRFGVLAIRLNQHGDHIVARLQALAAEGHFKNLIRWNKDLNKFVVGRIRLTEAERGQVDSLVWPEEDEIREALEALAVGDIDHLRRVNPTVAALLDAEEQ
jgi:hypothetical protein